MLLYYRHRTEREDEEIGYCKKVFSGIFSDIIFIYTLASSVASASFLSSQDIFHGRSFDDDIRLYQQAHISSRHGLCYFYADGDLCHGEIFLWMDLPPGYHGGLMCEHTEEKVLFEEGRE